MKGLNRKMRRALMALGVAAFVSMISMTAYAQGNAHRYVSSKWGWVKPSGNKTIPYFTTMEVDCDYPKETAVCNGYDIIPNDGNISHVIYVKMTAQSPVMDSDPGPNKDAIGCKATFFSRAIQGAWVQVHAVCEPMFVGDSVDQ